MDVAGNRVEAGHVRDEVAERTQKRFQDFLEEWRDEGDDGPKYLKVLISFIYFLIVIHDFAQGHNLNLKGARDLVAPERNTLQVSMLDVERLAYCY